MKTLVEPNSAADSQLVELCLRGNRNAFAQIVARYQSIICAIAYNACGDIGRSEDLAQDTFITAWRSLAQLHEPEKLKSWLCGIARNLTNNSVRQQQRVPTAMAGPLPPEESSGAATPSDDAISREEELLMWRTLATIPETYREPMILFYRENQSAQAVADTLNISEDAVRQRLARGRAMLTERVAKTIESALIKSAPGQAFTLAVLDALPATISAKAAAVGAAAARGGATAKAAGFVGMFAGFLATIGCFVGPWFGYRLEMEDSRSPEARRFVQQFFRILVAGMALFIVAILSLGKFGGSIARSHPAVYAGLSIGGGAAYLVFVVLLSIWARPRRRLIASAQTAPRDPAFEYRSKFTLLGLPLVHIRIRGGLARGPVKAWFAAGDSAIGVIFAFGAMAVAPVSFGGIAVGLLTLGGFAIGLVSFGGFSFGPWAFGAFAVGWEAFGVWAAGWKAAGGGIVAIAHDFADGSVALAAHANDGAAESFFRNRRFFNNVQVVLHYADWLLLIYLFPLVLWWRIRRQNRSSKAPP
jgi:RNA polymerase sigma factor (sigma-70 family)